MKTSFREIFLHEIDVTADSFSPSWPGESSLLEKSIEAVGLLQPPFVVERAGRFVPVCGIRRLRAAKKLSLSATVCRVLTKGQWSDGELLALNVEDNLSTREFGLFEKARLLGLARALGREVCDTLLERFGQRLGIAPHGREPARLRSLDRLPEPVKTFLGEKRVASRQALLFCDLTPADACSLAALARRHRLTAAQAGEWAGNIQEIMLRDSLAFDEVIRHLEDSFGDEERPAGGWREQLMEMIRELRFPEWKAREKAMTKCLGAVNGTQGVVIRPPPSFEGETFRAEILFRSPAELEKRVSSLARFAESGAAGEAFRLL